ncbi:MAG: HDIG domain-containing protein [Methanospirillum sp.]|uniref:HDIG domain-containing metalloprotein n=1 Tax=Methanospirillum sp. TaxID=45200 RepID=UPI00236A229F|nr:HDIG domain-containing metalloprotein [Methanospirillum sp.]MDD1729428.1 HDIG domain-containing protein [Methanospirillum sp.]
MPEPGDEYIRYLKETGCESNVISHCLTVREVAVRIADLILAAGMIPVDRDLVAAGAVLHDIGRSETHGMDHADAGGRICKEKKFSPAICKIVERHIGAGLNGSERVGFGLADEDRLPETIEEKIVAHADNLVKGSRISTREELNASIRKFPQVVQLRFTTLADELERLAGGRELP